VVVVPSSISLDIDAGIGDVGEANKDALSLSVLYNDVNDFLYIDDNDNDDDDDNDNALAYPINTSNNIIFIISLIIIINMYILLMMSLLLIKQQSVQNHRHH